MCVCVCVCIVTGEGEGVRGVMLQSFLAVAGDEGADKLSPGNSWGKEEKVRGKRNVQFTVVAFF